MTNETRDPSSLPHDLGKLPDELEATYDEINPLPASGYSGESHTYRGITGEDSTPVEAVVEALPDEDEEPTPPLAVPPPVRPAMQPPPPKRQQPRQRLAHPMIWLLLITSLTINFAGYYVAMAYLDTEVELRISERQTPQQLLEDRQTLDEVSARVVRTALDKALPVLSKDKLETLDESWNLLPSSGSPVDSAILLLLELEHEVELAAACADSGQHREIRLYARNFRLQLQKMNYLVQDGVYLESSAGQDKSEFTIMMEELHSIMYPLNPNPTP
ncbi:MAG: hypothetical protein ABH835_03535 [Patescibacteria group bacterium]